MNSTYRAWFFLVLVLALVPAGVRLFLWQRDRPQSVDLGMAQAGELLFNHEWTMNDPLCPNGDGLGPVYNATSCVACHHKGGVGGSGGVEHNVTTFVRVVGNKTTEGVVHAFHILGKENEETLNDVHPEFPKLSRPRLDQVITLRGRENHCVRMPAGVHVSQRNTPALFGAKLIDDIPERVIIAGARKQRVKFGMAPSDNESVPVGRALRLNNGKIGRFGWKAQMASLSDFVRAACANELGLGNPNQAQPNHIRPGAPVTQKVGLDLTDRQCDELTAFCASLDRPVERLPRDVSAKQAESGKKLFSMIGCADCHTQKLGNVDGIYSDLLLHNMGEQLVGGGSYGEQPLPRPDSDEPPLPSEWRTPPLWGVADSGPYMHDGRANTLEEAIALHGGQGARSARHFASLTNSEKADLIGFLKTLRAPSKEPERVVGRDSGRRQVALLDLRRTR
jgi:CxxC motif-containing protein (DUF1111 family)